MILISKYNKNAHADSITTKLPFGRHPHEQDDRFEATISWMSGKVPSQIAVTNEFGRRPWAERKLSWRLLSSV